MNNIPPLLPPQPFQPKPVADRRVVVGFPSRRSRIALFSVLLVWTAAPSFAQGQPGLGTNAVAEEIVSTTEVKGGLIVQLGCGDGELACALGSQDGVVMHALDRDPGKIKTTRQRIGEAGLYGKVSVERWRGNALPYVDNLVNLIICEEPGLVPKEEILRVLVPGGVAYLKQQGGAWIKTDKPRPKNTDEWTHAFYDPTNNAVSHDTAVAPPQHLQWVAGPLNTRSHEHASISTVVTASGRIFSIVDEAPAASTSLPSEWVLIARDAFNGVQLWRRPIKKWDAHPAGLYRGPPEISRRLVAIDGRVYVTLGTEAPVSVLDAASGETLTTYQGTEGTGEILYDEGRLYLVAAGPVAGRGIRLEPISHPGSAVTVLDTISGKVIWRKADARALSGTLAVHSGRVFYVDPEAVVCRDASSGEVVWRVPHPGPKKRLVWRAPTLVVSEDVVLCADRRDAPSTDVDETTGQKIAHWLAHAGAESDLIAYSTDNGEALWNCRCAESYYTPVDVFVNNGLVWVGESRARTGTDFSVGRDLHTGEVKHRIDTSPAFNTTMPHHRCFRDRATERFLVTGRTGVEFIDFDTGECSRHHWVRGVCRYGVVPANGLLYAPPHSCACFIEAKLTGFNALAPASVTRVPSATTLDEDRLERGPAFVTAETDNQQSDPGSWPTYRHDPARSGGTTSSLPSHLMALWRCDLGGRLSSPVVAGGRLFAASVDTHSVHAMDADTGKQLWTYTAGGRIDSPPTISEGLVVFGSADGWVHCLRDTDGELAWRYRAAPVDQRLMAFGQLESVWPVHGSVLVQDGAVLCVAGRSSYVDSGLYLLRLDLKTGRKLAEKRIYSRDSATVEQPDEPMMFEMPGALPDVLSSEGDLVYMRRLALDPGSLEDREAKPHLYSPAGFLDNSWWHRTYWIYGDHYYSGYIGWRFAGLETPGGRLLTLDDTSIFGFTRDPSRVRVSGAEPYKLFAVNREDLAEPQPPDYERAGRGYRRGKAPARRVAWEWMVDAPVIARAMVCAGDTLCVAGMPDDALRSRFSFGGKRGGGLCVLSKEDGNILQSYRLEALPVLDGMAVASGRLYLATQSGQIICLGDGASVVGATELLPFNGRRPRKLGGKPREAGLVGHWPFNEGEGTVALDSSGLQNDAEVRGRWVKGDFGTCISTQGVGQAVVIPDSELLHFGTASFSFEFWVKLDAPSCRLLGKEAFPQTWWVINVLQDGRLELVLAGPKKERRDPLRPTSKATVLTDRWTHVAYAVDRDNACVQCYLNGVLDSTTPIPPSFTGSLDVEGKDLAIPAAHNPFSGLLDEVRIYRRVLNAEEIQARYSTEKDNRTSTELEVMD